MNRPSRFRGVAGCLAASALALPLAICSFSFAQEQPAPGDQPTKLVPPTPGKPDEPPLIMNYLTMLIIIAAVVGANLIPSKRGHQD